MASCSHLGFVRGRNTPSNAPVSSLPKFRHQGVGGGRGGNVTSWPYISELRTLRLVIDCNALPPIKKNPWIRIRPKANLLRLDGQVDSTGQIVFLSRSALYKQLKAVSHFVETKEKAGNTPGQRKSGGFLCVCVDRRAFIYDLWSVICLRACYYWITEVFIVMKFNKIILGKTERIKTFYCISLQECASLIPIKNHSYSIMQQTTSVFNTVV